MKRQKRTAKSAKQRTQRQSAPDRAPLKRRVDRRALFHNLALGGVVVAGGVTGGWFLVKDVMATACEHDLTKLGNGIPTVVQIHDPQCMRCVALQREARDAMCEIDGEELQFLVANINSNEGRRLAAAHGVGNVTLLFFDGNGRRRAILAGNRSSDELHAAFKGHASRYAARP